MDLTFLTKNLLSELWLGEDRTEAETFSSSYFIFLSPRAVSEKTCGRTIWLDCGFSFRRSIFSRGVTGQGVGLQIVMGINRKTGLCDRLGSAQEFGNCLRRELLKEI